jgi:hypothetical protein
MRPTQSNARSEPTISKSNNNKPSRQFRRPEWLHSSIPKRHGKGMELVFLDKSSMLSSIPVELQLNIIQYLGYHDVLNLKALCQYYNYFISPEILNESRRRQIEDFEEIENRSQLLKPSHVPCYTCLKEKPIAQFYNVTGRYYYSTQPCIPLPDPGTRCCIPCAFKANLVAPGLNLHANGNSYLICSGCGMFSMNPVAQSINTFNGYSYGVYCNHCKHDFEKLLGCGWLFRFIQFVLGVIIFALACTGKSVPTTSVATKSSLRFIFTVTLVSLIELKSFIISLTAYRLLLPPEVQSPRWLSEEA